jgi:hypothetical protein
LKTLAVLKGLLVKVLLIFIVAVLLVVMLLVIVLTILQVDLDLLVDLDINLSKCILCAAVMTEDNILVFCIEFLIIRVITVSVGYIQFTFIHTRDSNSGS